jgi:hypothetical protein
MELRVLPRGLAPGTSTDCDLVGGAALAVAEMGTSALVCCGSTRGCVGGGAGKCGSDNLQTPSRLGRRKWHQREQRCSHHGNTKHSDTHTSIPRIGRNKLVPSLREHAGPFEIKGLYTIFGWSGDVSVGCEDTPVVVLHGGQYLDEHEHVDVVHIERMLSHLLVCIARVDGGIRIYSQWAELAGQRWVINDAIQLGPGRNFGVQNQLQADGAIRPLYLLQHDNPVHCDRR